MAHHHNTGVTGEELAANYLLDNGYSIIERNWRHKNWEVDIIASKENKLHFIEVKTRRTATYGYPEDDAGKKKITNLINSAEEYLLQYPEWKLIQFDILSVTMQKNSSPEFFLIEDVYI